MKKFIFIFIIFLAVVAAPTKVGAASVTLEAPPAINTGEVLDVIVNLNTDGVLVNSVEFAIDYDENLASFTGYSDENSVVKLWIDPPHKAEGLSALFGSSEQAGKIYLSGIVPGGVLGLYDPNKKGLLPMPLVHLFFTAKRQGIMKLSFAVSKILKHDGFGTPLPHEDLNVEVMIKNNSTSEITGEMGQKNNQENITREDSLVSQNSFNPILLVILLFVICGIPLYKLLKYKYGK